MAREPKMIEFDYQGFKFSVFKDGMTCFECEKKDAIRRFKRYGSEIVSIEKLEIKVDWRKYIAGYERDGNFYSHILRDINILTFSPQNNWEMDTGGICMNPISKGGDYMYFTREEDIREYAKLRGSNTVYSWIIRRFGEVFSKSEVLKL